VNFTQRTLVVTPAESAAQAAPNRAFVNISLSSTEATSLAVNATASAQLDDDPATYT